MSEQLSRRNNIELAVIRNSIRDNSLEETIINIKEYGIDILPMDIEACHRLPFSNTQATRGCNQCKRVIITLFNFKLPERLLQIKKTPIRSISQNHLTITDRVLVNTSLCPYYWFFWGQCKLLVNKKKIHQDLCMLRVLRFVKLVTYTRFFISVTFQSSWRKLMKKNSLFYLLSVASTEIQPAFCLSFN